jgi:hypothetical protein
MLSKDLCALSNSNYEINFVGDLCHRQTSMPIEGVCPHDAEILQTLGNVPYELTLSFWI